MNGEAERLFKQAEDADFGRRRNLARAAHLYLRAAKSGHREAQNAYAELLRDEVDTPKARKEAFQWFEAAALQGDASAQLSLGGLLFLWERRQPESEPGEAALPEGGACWRSRRLLQCRLDV